MLIALVLLPGYYIFGNIYKIALAPYVFYLVLSLNPVYIPALLIHFLPGTIMSQFILVNCLGVSFLKVKHLRKSGLLYFFILSILPLPVLAYLAWQKIFILDYGFIETLQHMALYLGLYPFFYGTLVYDRFTRQILNRIIVLLFIAPFLNVLGIVEGTVRYYWFSFPLFVSILPTYLLTRRKLDYPRYLLIISIIFILLVGIGAFGLRFTLIFSALFSCTIILLFAYRAKPILTIFTRKSVAILSVAVVAFFVANATDYLPENSSNIDLYDIESFEELPSTLQNKAFGDRAVLWQGGWNTMIQQNNIWPPLDIPLITFENADGVKIEGVQFGIHNIGLELLRQYGFIVGFISITVYLGIVAYCGRIFFTKSVPSMIVILSAVIIAVGITGGMVGQFVLMNNFSFLLTGLAGIVYGYSLIEE